MFPPHMPAPAKSIALNQTWQRIKLLFICCLLGFVAGITGATVVVAWFMPYNREVLSPLILPFIPSRSSVETELDRSVVDTIRTRLVTVYSGVIRESDRWYTEPRFRVGEALPITSDGWLMMPLSEKPAAPTSWSVVFGGKKLEAVTDTVYDPVYQMLFLKVRQVPSFISARVLEFGDEPALSERVYLVNSDRVESGVVTPLRAANEAELYRASPLRGRVSTVDASAAVVVNAQGMVVAMSRKDGSVVPIAFIQPLFDRIFTKKNVERSSLGVVGFFSEDTPYYAGGSTSGNGFLVTGVLHKNSPLRKGDSIEAVDGKIVTKDGAWYTGSNVSVLVDIVRGGKKLTVPVVLRTFIF